MRKGNILLVPFPFTDLSGNKFRPALVLAESEADVTIAFITTQIHWMEETDILIQPTPENGLKKESLLRLSKLATVDKKLVLGRLGDLDTMTLRVVNTKLKKILQLD